MFHFEVYTDRRGEYRWRLIASNGKIIADSGEGYRTKAACMHGLKLVRTRAATAKLEDFTGTSSRR